MSDGKIVLRLDGPRSWERGLEVRFADGRSSWIPVERGGMTIHTDKDEPTMVTVKVHPDVIKANLSTDNDLHIRIDLGDGVPFVVTGVRAEP